MQIIDRLKTIQGLNKMKKNKQRLLELAGVRPLREAQSSEDALEFLGEALGHIFDADEILDAFSTKNIDSNLVPDIRKLGLQLRKVAKLASKLQDKIDV